MKSDDLYKINSILTKILRYIEEIAMLRYMTDEDFDWIKEDIIRTYINIVDSEKTGRYEIKESIKEISNETKEEYIENREFVIKEYIVSMIKEIIEIKRNDIPINKEIMINIFDCDERREKNVKVLVKEKVKTDQLSLNSSLSAIRINDKGNFCFKPNINEYIFKHSYKYIVNIYDDYNRIVERDVELIAKYISENVPTFYRIKEQSAFTYTVNTEPPQGETKNEN